MIISYTIYFKFDKYLVFIWLRFHPPILMFLFCDCFSEVKRGTLFEFSKLSYHTVTIFLDNAFKENMENMLTGVKKPN